MMWNGGHGGGGEWWLERLCEKTRNDRSKRYEKRRHMMLAGDFPYPNDFQQRGLILCYRSFITKLERRLKLVETWGKKVHIAFKMWEERHGRKRGKGVSRAALCFKFLYKRNLSTYLSKMDCTEAIALARLPGLAITTK